MFTIQQRDIYDFVVTNDTHHFRLLYSEKTISETAVHLSYSPSCINPKCYSSVNRSDWYLLTLDNWNNQLVPLEIDYKDTTASSDWILKKALCSPCSSTSRLLSVFPQIPQPVLRGTVASIKNTEHILDAKMIALIASMSTILLFGFALFLVHILRSKYLEIFHMRLHIRAGRPGIQSSLVESHLRLPEL